MEKKIQNGSHHLVYYCLKCLKESEEESFEKSTAQRLSPFFAFHYRLRIRYILSSLKNTVKSAFIEKICFGQLTPYQQCLKALTTACWNIIPGMSVSDLIEDTQVGRSFTFSRVMQRCRSLFALLSLFAVSEATMRAASLDCFTLLGP